LFAISDGSVTRNSIELQFQAGRYKYQHSSKSCTLAVILTRDSKLEIFPDRIMRKLAFIDIIDEIRKLMIYQSDEGVFVFGYDCLQETSSKWDNWFMTVEEAVEYCQDVYKIDDNKWISISDPLENCQHDFIMPTRVKGLETGNPEYGKFQTLIDNKWVDIDSNDRYNSLDGLTGNERLFVTGLIYEFDRAKKNDKTKARQILMALEFDEKSIERIV
jgi:hypothetical protein